MGFISNLKWSLNKRLSFIRKARTWKKYGSETRYHYDNPDFEIGEFTYGVPEIRVYDVGIKLKIGRFCSIADNVKILLGGAHYTDWASSYPFYYKHREVFTNLSDINAPESKDTVIGNDVWIGNGVTILSGKTIGNGAVIGSGAVVSKDIPPYAIAVGNPIRIIRYRFDEETIAKLQETGWWNLPTEQINTLLPYIQNTHQFIIQANILKSRVLERGGGKYLYLNLYDCLFSRICCA